MTSSIGVSNSLKFILSGWKEVLPKNDEELGAARRDIQWTLQRAVPILVPASSFITPTAFTPHVACRYSLLLQMKVAGYRNAQLTLVTPIQVVYSSRQTDSTLAQGGEATETSIRVSRLMQIANVINP